MELLGRRHMSNDGHVAKWGDVWFSHVFASYGQVLSRSVLSRVVSTGGSVGRAMVAWCRP